MTVNELAAKVTIDEILHIVEDYYPGSWKDCSSLVAWHLAICTSTPRLGNCKCYFSVEDDRGLLVAHLKDMRGRRKCNLKIYTMAALPIVLRCEGRKLTAAHVLTVILLEMNALADGYTSIHHSQKAAGREG